MSETELLTRIAADDEAAFAELTENHSGLIRTTLRRCGIKKQDIDDLEQESLMQIYRKRKQFDPASDGANWIIMLTRSYAIDWRKRNQPPAKYTTDLIEPTPEAECPRCHSKQLGIVTSRAIYECRECRKQFPLDFKLPKPDDEEPPDIRDLCDTRERSAEEIAETKEQVALLRERIELLSAERREALELYYFHGLTWQEIAKRMNISRKDVENRVLRAIEALRRMDEDNEGTAPSPARPKRPLISGGAHVLAIAI